MFRKYSVYEASIEEWKSILGLAHLWQCDEVRDLVFRELYELDVPHVERVLLATRFEARERWRVDALEALAWRRQPLSRKERKLLGKELTVRIAEMRNRPISERRSPEAYPVENVGWPVGPGASLGFEFIPGSNGTSDIIIHHPPAPNQAHPPPALNQARRLPEVWSKWKVSFRRYAGNL